MTRSERSGESIDKYLKAGARGTLNLVMRFGKTRIGLRLAARFNKKYPNEEVIVAVPSIAIVDRWHDENETINADVTIFTYDTLLKTKGKRKCGLLIIDEIHKITSKERLKIINGTIIDYKYILGLTGTFPSGEEGRIISKYAPVVDVINEEEALANKWISNFREYNVRLNFSPQDRTDYTDYTHIMYKVSEIFDNVHRLILTPKGETFFNSDMELILGCYKGVNVKEIGHVPSKVIRDILAMKLGWHDNLNLNSEYDARINTYWNPNNIKKNATKYYKAMEARNSILINSEVKQSAVLDIYNKFIDRTMICFNGSISFSEILTDTINNYISSKEEKAIAYHSDVKGKPLINFINGEYFVNKSGKDKGLPKKFGKKNILKYIYNMTTLGLINFISTVNALDEGLNIPNLDLVITTFGSTNPTQYSQRTARGKTVDMYNPNKITIIVNLFFGDFKVKVDGEYKLSRSRDYKKLQMRQEYKPVPIYSLKEFLKMDIN